MSSDFFALPELVPAGAGASAGARGSAGERRGRHPACDPATTRRTRALRCARLLFIIVRLWLVAIAVAPRLSPRQRAVAVQRWAHRLLRTLRVSVRARGHVPTSDAPLLVVANHVSWLDTYALNTVSAARFVAKDEVRTWSVIGTIAARFGTVFLKRGCPRAAARAVGVLAQALSAAEPIGAFPEGTTSDGRGLLPFYPALFQAAVISGARVQPVAIRYRRADGRPTQAAAFVGDMSILDSLRRLVREPRLTVDLVFCAPLDSAGHSRREIAALARAAIGAALGVDDDASGDHPLRRAA
jgi:1-acyl-sn-glycerol-3-phosphate acyltransferase